MSKSVLLIAFHFPPIAVSSGVQRALKTVRYLREEGWRPVVLTVSPRAYPQVESSQLAEIPHDVPVHRAFALDTRRHLSIRGWYPGLLAWPDPWVSWWPAAVLAGRRLIKRHRPAVIWSTFPITTAKLVALHLARWSGIPWVADFRDPMTMDGYPADPVRFKLARLIEKRTVDLAQKVVFTAERTRAMYEERYPGLAGKSVLIRNGYDESNFPVVLRSAGRGRGRQGPVRLLHSGALQPVGRNPETFFAALSRLKQAGEIDASSLRVVFRACGFEQQYGDLARRLDVDDIVAFEDRLPYEQAIQEMVEVDGLLVFQGTAYNYVVPAKIYEYFFARRPIFAVVDKAGETCRLLDEVGFDSVADIAKPDEIAEQLSIFLRRLRDETYVLPADSAIEGFSRRRQTQKLSALLAEMAAG